MENKKYKLDDEDTITVRGETLYRIVALRDVGDMVKAGDKGGYIGREVNLAHTGDCWVDDEAKVYQTATVVGDAQVFGRAEVFGGVHICHDTMVYGDVKLCGNCWGDELQVYSNKAITDEDYEARKPSAFTFKLTITKTSGDPIIMWFDDFAKVNTEIEKCKLTKNCYVVEVCNAPCEVESICNLKISASVDEKPSESLLNELKSRGGVLAALAEAGLLYLKKSADYNGGGIDNSQYFPFGAVSYAQMLHVKATRFNALVRKDLADEAVNFEGLRDTALDIINYAAMYVDSATYD